MLLMVNSLILNCKIKFVFYSFIIVLLSILAVILLALGIAAGALIPIV